MPILRYRCKKCAKEFQVYQKITDSPLKKCSFCEGKVDLIPVPLFYNTPSFSLAFAEKDEGPSKTEKSVPVKKKQQKINESIKKKSPKQNSSKQKQVKKKNITKKNKK